MPDVTTPARIRPLTELDLGSIVRIDERISGIYRPEIWERRVLYYLRRDPDASQVAEVGGQVVGFMFGDVREGEFGIEQPSGWIERFGIDPEQRGQELGKQMFDALRRHFAAQGATTVRTMVNREEAGVAGFLGAMGFAPSSLQALEMTLTPGA